MAEAKDLKNLRDVMRKAISAARLQVRDLESRLGITHGALEKLLDGRLEIRLRHVMALSEMLQVSPADLLEVGCPDAHRAAKYKMSDWLGTKAAKAEKPAAALPSPTELAEMIRQAVREELKAQAATPDSGEAPGGAN